jgi:hypothetical protein
MKKPTQYVCCKFLVVFRKSHFETLPKEDLVGWRDGTLNQRIFAKKRIENVIFYFFFHYFLFWTFSFKTQPLKYKSDVLLRKYSKNTFSHENYLNL